MAAKGILLSGGKPKDQWCAKFRQTAWIFGMGNELLLGASDLLPLIQDGESYHVYQVFAAGKGIPRGEGEKANQWAKGRAIEFHHAMELRTADVASAVRSGGPTGTLRRNAFWIENMGKGLSDQNWRVTYVMRQGTQLVDVLCLGDKLRSNAKLMVAVKSFRIGLIQSDIEKGFNIPNFE